MPPSTTTEKLTKCACSSLLYAQSKLTLNLGLASLLLTTHSTAAFPQPANPGLDDSSRGSAALAIIPASQEEKPSPDRQGLAKEVDAFHESIAEVEEDLQEALDALLALTMHELSGASQISTYRSRGAGLVGDFWPIEAAPLCRERRRAKSASKWCACVARSR